MQTEPKYIKYSYNIGDASLNIKGEDWGDGFKDTEVKIGDTLLCWIVWNDKDAFIKELNEVVEKYRI